MDSLGIDYTGHVARLSQLRIAMRFCAGAIEKEWQRTEGQREQALEQISEGIDDIFAALAPNPHDTPEKISTQKAEFGTAMREAACFDASSRRLLINLALVMCCTELEVFITHLIDVILVTEPRLLKSIASQKSLTGAELVDLESSEKIFQALRDKVAKEVTDQGTKDMFSSHLGKRFGLMVEDDLLFPGNLSLQKDGFCGLDQVKEIFDKRHQIVHRGTLPLDGLQYFENSISLFLEIERLLARNAVAKYHCPLKSTSCRVLLDFGGDAASPVIDIGVLLGRALRAVKP